MEKATHLNAFFTPQHFNAFSEMLREAVDEYWDPDIYDEMVEEYDIEADLPDEMDEEQLAEARDQMYIQITKAFKRGWEKDEE